MKLIKIILLVYTTSIFATINIINTEKELLYVEINRTESGIEILNDTIATESEKNFNLNETNELDINLFFGAPLKSTRVYGIDNTQNCSIIVKKRNCRWWDFSCIETKPKVSTTNCGNPAIE